MSTYTYQRILTRPQLIPVFIPDETTIKAYKKIGGDSWFELDRIDLSDSSSTDSYSFDADINMFFFNPLLVGSQVQIQYEHNNVPNPSTVDLLPTVLGEMAVFNNNRILSGLYVTRTYVNGDFTGWNGFNMVLTGGTVVFDGQIYCVADTHWDLNKFGAQAGIDQVHASCFYINGNVLGGAQKTMALIHTPKVLKSSRYSLGDGGGIGSANTELNRKIVDMVNNDIIDLSNFIEVLRITVLSKAAPEPPDVHLYYEPKFRHVPAF